MGLFRSQSGHKRMPGKPRIIHSTHGTLSILSAALVIEMYLEGGELVPLLLEASDDLADQVALDAVGLDHDVGALHGAVIFQAKRQELKDSTCQQHITCQV